ncbi:MAG: DNA translocase FtsK [Clostridiales bacterium]|nr:DNA translocase FtsK [Clostridiales bacterium]
MSTATRKKAKPTIRSTDRGGPVLLSLGLALLAFGLMLLLGTSLQTSAGSLDLFKWMAIGLGGGLYWLLPFVVIWLALQLMVASKRYVSMYPLTISLLLLLCVLALMSLTLKVNDRSFPMLMDYIKNINALRGASYPDSMGEYLRTSYSLRNWLSISGGMYPGGGALSMLLAYPLYVTVGSVGAIVLLVLMAIALVFALLRISPVRLVAQISDRINRVPPRPARETAQATAQPAQPHQVEAQYPEDLPGDELAPQPQWAAAAQQPENAAFVPAQQLDWQPQPEQPSPAFSAQPQEEPGFVRQPAGTLFEEGDHSGFTQPAATRPPARPQQAPLEDRLPWDEPAAATAAAAVQQPMLETTPEAQPGRKRRRAATTQIETNPETTTPKQAAPVASTVEATKSEAPAPQPTASQAAKPVLTQPAHTPREERVAVPQKVESPGKGSLDNMVRAPQPKQIRLALDDYQVPPLRLLTEGMGDEQHDTTQEDLIRAEKLIETLKSFSITAHLHDIVHGPTVTRFAIRLAEGIKVSKLRSVMDNLTIELKAKGDIRAEMPIPGTSFVGLEVSNDKTSKVFLRDVLESSRMRDNKSPTAVALGKDITGTPIISELMDMPHLLIAGATGSGKSVCINSIICSMLYRASPRHVRMIMVDPKFVELQPYNDVPHLMMPVITDAKKATAALDWVCQEMDRRYQVLVDAGVRNLDAYNKRLEPDEEPLPRIIVIVDEMADLMTTSGKMIEDHIKRITAKARAAGICLILATQRPSVNIITGVIKANIPGRIAFRVSSPFDSKTILDNQGAEKLLGYGDMLYRSTTREPIRVQGCFVSDRDVEQTVAYITNRNQADYNLDLIEHVEQADQPEGANGGPDSAEVGDAAFDELLPQAIEMAVESGQMSISMLQRVLRIGYARSGRLIDEMSRRGIISGNEGTKPRRTLMTREQYLNYLESGEQ